MCQHIRHHVAMCETCQKVKADAITTKATLKPIHILEAPMQFISMDIATFPTDVDRYKHILLIGDIFSKYISAVPLNDTISRDYFKNTVGLRKNCRKTHGGIYYLRSYLP